MKAMILAAGRGTRMGALTENTPKPLLKIADKPLIVWQIERLHDNGFDDIVINVGYLGDKIREALGDGSQYGVKISYSIEPQTGLETGGGVFQALALLGDAPFLLTNADIFCDYPYRRLKDKHPLGVHLVLVENPSFKAAGDFSIQGERLIFGDALTFAGISVIHPRLFAGCRPGVYRMAPLFRQAIKQQMATAEAYWGMWHDVGTPKRLQSAFSALVSEKWQDEAATLPKNH